MPLNKDTKLLILCVYKICVWVCHYVVEKYIYVEASIGLQVKTVIAAQISK